MTFRQFKQLSHLQLLLQPAQKTAQLYILQRLYLTVRLIQTQKQYLYGVGTVLHRQQRLLPAENAVTFRQFKQLSHLQQPLQPARKTAQPYIPQRLYLTVRLIQTQKQYQLMQQVIITVSLYGIGMAHHRQQPLSLVEIAVTFRQFRQISHLQVQTVLLHTRLL